nr:MAG TPA: hypothetical protein [Caudoviricetes sp.]
MFIYNIYVGTDVVESYYKYITTLFESTIISSVIFIFLK